MNLRSTCDDLTSLNDSLKRLTKTVEGLPQGSDERVAAERSLYQAQLVMKGAGPAGALDGYLKPPRNGKFLSLLMGNAVDVTSQRQENRLRIKEEYYSFRDRSTFTYVAWTTALLYLNRERQKGVEAGASNNWFSLVTVFPVLVQFYWCWMLFFYAALALRENVLRCNGSRIRRWWINHHYYSMGMCLVVLTMDVQSNACLNYMSRFLVFTALQGVVMLTQNRYQRFRLYTRVAMGKASPMDVAGGEMGGNAGQLKLLYPLLFGLQIMQVYFGASVLVSVAREHDLLDGLGEVYFGEWLQRLGHTAEAGVVGGTFFREWQAPCAGALFVVMGVGNFRATIQTYFTKRKFAKESSRSKAKRA